ncbi:MAG: heavy metal translocating P-type ATPase [Bdellovibrionales bacterium]
MPIALLQPEPVLSGSDTDRASAELLLASTSAGPDAHEINLVVPEIHCAACIARIERALAALPGINRARVNLSTRRVYVSWAGPDVPPVLETLARLGFSAHTQADTLTEGEAQRGELVRALAVAGFASMNIMLLSVAIWSGASEQARQLFHWLSALIALPTLVYSGRPFFRSAWRVLRRGQTNMDVPISIGVLTAFGLSIYETVTQGSHAYFDAAVMLLFFLLVGRTLDHVMRGKARMAVQGLARLATRGATVIRDDGAQQYLSVERIVPGMTLLIAAGERVPVNARVLAGTSEADVSLLTGESAPETLRPGDSVWAGTLNTLAPLTVEVVAAARDSFLAEMLRMLEAAEEGRSTYRRIADRAARLYAPVVHLTALITLMGWWISSGDIHHAITTAVAVLIITCPCALGLAVPMVHVVAAQRLFSSGVMVKDGGALERLAEVDSIIFDKTGTLTMPETALASADAANEKDIALAATLARHSLHPYASAIARGVPADDSGPYERIRENPGAGIEGWRDGVCYRLGRAAWAQNMETLGEDDGAILFTGNGKCLARFRFESNLRPETEAAIQSLRQVGFSIEILSGDHDQPVRALAESLGIPYRARVSPAEKVAHITARVAAGERPLMVGDGLNDAPALVAAHASMAPATAADIGRNAADFVFLHAGLMAVPNTIRTARRAAALVRQNIAMAVIYNILAVPVAIAGYVTPLVAAIAMSASSILVVANALRLGFPRSGKAGKNG